MWREDEIELKAQSVRAKLNCSPGEGWNERSTQTV